MPLQADPSALLRAFELLISQRQNQGGRAIAQAGQSIGQDLTRLGQVQRQKTQDEQSRADAAAFSQLGTDPNAALPQFNDPRSAASAAQLRAAQLQNTQSLDLRRELAETRGVQQQDMARLNSELNEALRVGDHRRALEILGKQQGFVSSESAADRASREGIAQAGITSREGMAAAARAAGAEEAGADRVSRETIAGARIAQDESEFVRMMEFRQDVEKEEAKQAKEKVKAAGIADQVKATLNSLQSEIDAENKRVTDLVKLLAKPTDGLGGIAINEELTQTELSGARVRIAVLKAFINDALPGTYPDPTVGLSVAERRQAFQQLEQMFGASGE